MLNVGGGAVAQLGERYNRTVEVRGSSPLSSTAGQIRPEEEKVDKFGPVAQSGAHLNGIEGVVGSSPTRSTFWARMRTSPVSKTDEVRIFAFLDRPSL